MKKSALLILGLLLATTAFAKEVTQSEAVAVAQRMMKQRATTELEAVTPMNFDGKKAYYVVQYKDGWALMSADDVASPMVAYSETGTFPVDNMPENLNGWLGMLAREVQSFKKISDVRSTEWDRTATIQPMATDVTVSPLITVTWNQGSPYNKYCPSNANGTSYVGCVAVATAQAMSVIQYPPRPQGSISYSSDIYGTVSCNFDNEPDYNWANILSGANNMDDVARFLWHCGVSAKMNYTTSGSGTMTSYVPNALKTYFDYPNSVTYVSKDNYDDATWKEMVIAELQAGRPIIYCGYPSTGGAGHCFNIDGYNNGSFHVNWGWGGSGDCYTTLSQLKSQVVPGGSIMEFTVGHGMVVDLRAPNNNPQSISLSNKTVAINQPIGTVVGAVTVVSDAKNPTYTYEVYGKKNNFTGKYLTAPFEVVDGNLVTTSVLTADNFVEDIVLGTMTCEVNIKATNTELGTSATGTFQIEMKGSTGIEDVEFDANAPVEYYNLQGIKVTNPEKGVFIKKQGSKTAKVVLM